MSSAHPPLEEVPGDGALVRLNVEALAEPAVEAVRTRLWELAESRPGQHLHLDLGLLEYLTSSGLALFVGLHQKVRAGGGHLTLHNVREPVYELFQITRLTALLDIRRQQAEGEPNATASA